MTGNIFETCLSEFPDGNTSVMMECVSNTLEEVQNDKDADLKSFLFVIAGAMIFFMQSGFAMVCAGAVRVKNVQNSMLKNLLDACGAALAFYLVGKLLVVVMMMMMMMIMMIMLLEVDKI
jgi:hypothetical protein